MKQETPEEAAERIYPMVSNEYLWHVPIETRKIFIEGAKWQQERSYSEEDLKEAFKYAYTIGFRSFIFDDGTIKQENCEEWFELFKNK